MREYGVYIDGAFAPAASGRTFTSIDPSNGEPVAVAARAAPRDARRALEAARRAFDEGAWSGRSQASRRDTLIELCDLLSERQADLADLEARDAGMPIRTATAMVAAAVQHARELVEIAASVRLETPVADTVFPKPARATVVREPYGVVSAIVPFNAPLVLSAWKVFPALATGNVVVLKPSPYTPCTAMELAIAAEKCGLPRGVLNVLPGGEADVGQELASNPLVDRVAFTGSTEAGRRVGALAAQTVKRVTLELGGKSANVVLDDADLELAVAGAVWAAFLQSGQTCQAGSRLLVPSHLHDEVVERVVAAAAQLRVGETRSWDTDLGPLISQRQLERVERYVAIGREEGAALACGGHRLADDGLERGYYFAPTVFAGARNDMRIAREEIFGPVLTVIPYETDEDAVAVANDTIYGLAAAVWGADEARAEGVARRLRAGTVWVNDYHSLTTAAPYGGWGASGVGTELGEAGCLEYLQTKHLWVGEGDLRARPWLPVVGLDRVFGVRYD